MKIASKSDIGRVRSSNQDSFAAGEIYDAAWAVVCDGMGGANGGNIASGIAVKTISDCVLSAYHSDMKSNSIIAMLESSITAANLNVFDEAVDHPELKGMGTTVVSAIVSKDSAIIAHAGDSRAYLISNGIISQITRDHSIVQNMVEKGEITPDEAKNDPRKHVITRALGVNEDISIEFNEIEFAKGSILLLCTDGLTNFVSSSEISKIIAENNIDRAPFALVDAANAGGGSDNITVVLISNE